MEFDNSKVKLVSECFVKPKYEVQESKTPHYLLGGLTLLSIAYMQKGFLFKKPTTFDSNMMNSFLVKMKSSLSQVLVYYYPLAGRFTTVKYEDEQACSIYVDCNKGPGARFVHATLIGTGVSVSDIVAYCSFVMPTRTLFDLGETKVVNYDGHTRALVTLQVTELEDGVLIGFTMNHSIADGTSFLHFVKSLSEIFGSIDIEIDHANDDTILKISHVPIFKPVIPDGCSLIQKLPCLEPEELISRSFEVDPRLNERVFHFSSSSMAKLKATANFGNDGVPKISSFQALAALVWISINKARKVAVQETTTCFIPIDARSRFEPPLSTDHFGVLAQPLWVTKKVGELLENGLGWTAMLLNQAIEAHDGPATIQYCEAVMKKPFVIRPEDETVSVRYKQSHIMFTWSARFDMYGPEFGFGKAVAVLNGYAGKSDGKVTVSQGRAGEGSVEIGVCLLHENMIRLESDQDFMSYVS